MKRYFELTTHENQVWNAFLNGAVPLKYAYSGSASITHARLAASAGYQAANWRAETETRIVSELLGSKANKLVEFGPGTGDHSAFLLNHSTIKNGIEAYIGVDFSRMLFAHALPKLRKSMPRTTVSFVHADLESEPAQTMLLLNHPVVFVSFGSLLGNVESPESTAVNIRDSVPRGSTGLLAVSGCPLELDTKQILKPYESEEFRLAALEPVLTLGLKASDVSFDLKWNAEDLSVNAFVELNQNFTNIDKDFTVPAGFRAQCFTSRRFTPARLENLLNEAGFSEVKITASIDQSSLFAEVKT